MEALLSVCLGLGLAAACGFRVFVPFLVMNLASRAGALELTGSFDWIGSTPALIAFSIATALEIGAYYVPWVDNLLDTVATPAAVIAGTVATASVVTGMDPMMKWTLALIAGGSVAGGVQAATVGFRQASLLGTGGLGNPVVSSLEAGSAASMTLLSLFLPAVAMALIVLCLIGMRRFFKRRQLA